MMFGGIKGKRGKAEKRGIFRYPGAEILGS